eukprot:TRINITY_DN14773_c0_g1_i1.p1 TRINITY_DN14773_c0_g1~~TRINITY_DN14773_c0_g1_i1.p1  ORF type:complete len:135 (+),score=33.64 TRINITY_DN14773_c0_g1_i1:155-559(+)
MHDICYGLCGTSFGQCEKEFAACMKGVCKGQSNECTETAQSFTGMTGMFGGGMFDASQKEACDCFDTKEEARARQAEYVTQLYQRNNPAKLEDAKFVEGILDRSPQPGKLLTKLLRKYGTEPGEVVWDGVKAEL